MTASARGLFRATGKKSKPLGVTSGTDLAGDFSTEQFPEREKDDFYPTPPEPTQAFLNAEQQRLREFREIWEPACGDGAMVRDMHAIGLTVFATDLVQRGAAQKVCNFYDFKKPEAKAIVTNPPFDECNKDPGFVRHALETLGVEYMALLLPLNWFGAVRRAKLWAQFPPARVYVMRWRIDFTGQGAPPMPNCWVVWDRKYKGETLLRMLDRKDARQGEMAL